MITVNGSAAAIAAVCSADSPPASSSTAATTPSLNAQNTRCQTGGLSWPPEVSVSITSEPESDDVTKKVTTRMVATSEDTEANGKYSRNRYSAVGTSASTAADSA